jgi:hypothetical protein
MSKIKEKLIFWGIITILLLILMSEIYKILK